MNRPARARSSGSASVMSSPSKQDLALGDLEARVAHDRVGERRLAGAVGAHERVELAGADVQVDALEDLLVPGGDVEVLDLEVGHGLRVGSGRRRGDGRRGLGRRALGERDELGERGALQGPDDAQLHARPQQLGGAVLARRPRASTRRGPSRSSKKQSIGAIAPSSASTTASIVISSAGLAST